VWIPDFKGAEFSIGEAVDWDALRAASNGNIEVLESGKWWLVDYCRFQHGDLFSHKQSAALASYIKLLEEHGLTQRVKQQFGNSSASVLGIGLGKGKGEEEEKTTYAEDVTLTKTEHEKLVAQYGEAATKAFYKKLSGYKGSSGHKYKSDYKAILTWVADEVLGKNPKLKEQAARAGPGDKCPRHGFYMPLNADGKTRYCKDCEQDYELVAGAWKAMANAESLKGEKVGLLEREKGG
jgi:hypothetical protein